MNEAKLLIQEEWVNRTENYRSGETEPYEPWTQDIGRLYHSLVREYGRCTGRVYIDSKENGAKAVGWVFLKRRKYDDSNDTFLCETWVTVHDAMPETTVTHKYHYFD